MKEIVERPVLVRLAACILLLGAAAIHFMHTPHHFEDAVLYGWFFLVTGGIQLGAAIAVLRPKSRAFYLAMASFSLSLIALWALTRTLGVPLGLRAGIVEPAGAADLTAGAFELLTAALFLSLSFEPGFLLGAVAAKTAGVTLMAVGVGASGLVVIAEKYNRTICHHHNPAFGPLAALEGHSILPEGRPPVDVPLRQDAAVMSGFLINCGTSPVEVIRATPLSYVGDSAAIEKMTMLTAGHRPVESLCGRPSEGKRQVSVPPSIHRPDFAIYSTVAPKQPGLSFLNAVEIEFRYRGETQKQPLATSVTINVVVSDDQLDGCEI